MAQSKLHYQPTKMSNYSEQKIEILIQFLLNYSRIFGICNFSYDFKKRKLTHPRVLVVYIILANTILVLLLPFSLYTQFQTNSDLLRDKDLTFKVRQIIALVNAVAVCSSLFGQWRSPEKIRSLFDQFSVIRRKECSTLRRIPCYAHKCIGLFISKSIISAIFVIGCFGTMFLETENRTLQHTIISIYYAVVENIIVCVENQFYFGLVFSNYLFELLNEHMVSVAKEILALKTKFYRRGGMNILIIRRGLHLTRELEIIGKIHTTLFDLVHIMRDLYQFQILTVLLTVFVTQLSIFFTIISYFLKNQIQMPKEYFYVEGFRLVMSVANFWLLIYICGSVVYQCNLGGEHIKMLNSKQHLSISLENKIEMLSFQFKREKMHLSLCGLIDLDWATGFHMTSALAMDLVLLLQLDYKNLLEESKK